MSSLFSIGEDELDLDDEDCLLAVCDVASSVNCIAENSNKNSGSKQNQLGSHVQLLRTKEVDKFNSHYSRRPFESLSNINSYDRVSDKKITSTEQLHGGTSFRSKTDCQSNSVTATPSGYNEPLAKRFAADHNSTSKPLSENRASLLRSSNSPVFKNTCDSSTFSRDTTTRDSRFVQCNSRPSDSREAYERMDPLHNDSSTCNLKSNFSSGKEISGHNESTFNSFRAIPMHASNTMNVNTTCTSSVLQQRGPPRNCNNQTRDLPQQISRTSSPLHNQPERNLSYSFNRNMNTTKAPETPIMCRERTVPGLSTPQVHRATTPVVNKSGTRTPFSSKTPKTRKFPGPAGLLPKLSPGQNLDDSSVASPLPSRRKKSPVENKVQVSQSNVSEEEDFNRDPWTYMHQDFVKNVPMSMRYTIIQVYTEAIQQRLDHGKVPCLCALVKAFSLTEADASVLLKDPTGEIHGTLHRKVLEKFQNELAPGAGLILKHVSVFSPAPRKHYLNITPGNILQIYPPDPQYMSSSQALASQCTQVESKQEQQSVVIEDDDVNKIADCNKETNTSDERAAAAKEDEWMQKDCFEDLLEGLDDDEDFLDEALLV